MKYFLGVFLMVFGVAAHASDADLALADRIGFPEPGAEFYWVDDAMSPVKHEAGYDDAQWREELERRMHAASGSDKPHWLIELGWIATKSGDRSESDEYYERAAGLVGESLSLQRRLAWSRGRTCAVFGDFGCALRYWHQAASAIEEKATWIPEHYAYALWALDRREQALAWYSVAVRSNAGLGRGPLLRRIGSRRRWLDVSEILFKAWSNTYAPLRITVDADVDIDTDGRLSRIVMKDSPLDPEVLDRVRLAALNWRFAPVLHEGTPVKLSTYLQIDVRGRTVNGVHQFEMQYAGIGPRRLAGTLSYPRDALKQGREGGVVLDIEVSTEGKVVQIEVADSSGSTILDGAAKGDVEQWKYQVEKIDGRPRSSRGPILISYRLRTRLRSAAYPIDRHADDQSQMQNPEPDRIFTFTIK